MLSLRLGNVENIYFTHCIHIQWRQLVLNCKIVPINARGTSPDGYFECGYTCVLLNCNIMPNACGCATSPDDYFECGSVQGRIF